MSSCFPAANNGSFSTLIMQILSLAKNDLLKQSDRPLMETIIQQALHTLAVGVKNSKFRSQYWSLMA